MEKKFLVILFNVLFLFNLNVLVHAATVTWTGSGPDNLASNTANWSDGIIPQNGDKVVFDTTSSKDCTWDLSVMLSTFMINPGYTGTVIITSVAGLSIENYKTWTGAGSDNLASNPANWPDNAMPQNGDKIIFDDSSTKDCTWDIDVTPASLTLSGYTGILMLNTNLAITGSLNILSGILNLNDKDLNVEGYVLIGTYGNLYATSSAITVKGDWANAGNFSPGHIDSDSNRYKSAYIRQHNILQSNQDCNFRRYVVF